MKHLWSWDRPPCNLNLGINWRCMVSQHNFNRFISCERTANIHGVGNWSCPRFSLDMTEKRQILWPCREQNSNHPIPSLIIILVLTYDPYKYYSFIYIYIYEAIFSLILPMDMSSPLTMLIIFREKYKLLSSSLYDFFQPPVTFFFVHYPQDFVLKHSQCIFSPRVRFMAVNM
jgi:hypothetical protein